LGGDGPRGAQNLKKKKGDRRKRLVRSNRREVQNRSKTGERFRQIKKRLKRTEIWSGDGSGKRRRKINYWKKKEGF